jgi:LysM repeat protein
MKSDKSLIRLAALALGVACCLPCFAETPEQIEQRLEDLRRMDAEAVRRREETLEFQARRKREEYARRWKRYGDDEIDILKWWQQKDGTWVTELKKVIAQSEADPLISILERAIVRFGDTAIKIAQRYDLTLQEFLQLNPGLETVRLVVGSHVRIARSTPGGVTWPTLPGFESKLPNRPPARFDASLDELVRDEVVSADERDRIQGMRRSLIGVNCTSLMVNRKPADERWGTWTRPGKASTDEQLVIDRCGTRR